MRDGIRMLIAELLLLRDINFLKRVFKKDEVSPSLCSVYKCDQLTLNIQIEALHVESSIYVRIRGPGRFGGVKGFFVFSH